MSLDAFLTQTPPTSSPDASKPASRKRAAVFPDMDFLFEDSDAPKTAKKPRTPRKKAVPKQDQGTSSMSKKDIGDMVKSCLAMEKYHIPTSHFTFKMDTTFFRHLFLSPDLETPPTSLTPSTFDDTTPVVVLELDFKAAADRLGISKCRGGNRFTQLTLTKVCVVFWPTKGESAVWVTV